MISLRKLSAKSMIGGLCLCIVSASTVAEAAEPKTNRAQQQSSDIMVLETTVTGSQEQPKMITVVPWKKTASDDLERRIESLIDQQLTPVERRELLREIRYGQPVDAHP
ncbi:Uncharacterised protein [BD1-7 clade bacterium]|uniref:Uncharacterized protein n=1 Tax=BD1-7 clade bacterium TaxID=2029982 RepID=A0A5S9QQ79_9GAMM|nr:Uncharacterised protein [BD1-7 clade bacterium]